MAIASVKVSSPATKSRSRTETSKYQALAPDAKMYGIYAPQYAAYLAAPTTSATEAAFHENMLRSQAFSESSDYAKQLAAANAIQEKLQSHDAYYGILGDNRDHLNDDVEQGMGGVRTDPVWDEQYGVWKSPLDSTRLDVSNNVVLDKADADINKTKADTYGVLAKELGIRPDVPYLSKEFTSPAQTTPVPFEDGYKSPTLENTIYGTDEGLTAPQQLERATLGASSKDAPEPEITVELPAAVGPDGKPTRRRIIKGTPTELRAAGIDPSSGTYINPNAGANGGTAPATPAAPKKNAPKLKARPVRNGRRAALSVYPNLKITGNYRGANDPLTKANPTSWHHKSHAAIDARPIKGMTFDQYIQGYKDKGFHIIEQKDEVKHPSKHATGPHWHVVLGENPQQHVPNIYAARLSQHPMVAKTQDAGEGKILVTMKDGSQRVYLNGKRIG